MTEDKEAEQKVTDRANQNETGVVFQNSTIRQTIRMTLSADTLRLQISNAFGISDLPITAASIALPATNATRSGSGVSAIDTSTLRALTFSGGLTNYTIPPGALALTDPIFDFPVDAGDIATISLYLADGQTTNSITSHPGSRTTSHFVLGNAVNATDLAADDSHQSADHWYLISTLSGYVASESSALAVLGDSITDGRGSTTNGNDRWPDVLSERLSSSSSGISVLNLAAGGNRILHDGLGPSLLSRIDRDVLAAAGVKYAMVFEGVNDIGTAGTDVVSQTDVGNRLLAAFEQITARLHARGLPVFGATITPFSGPGQTCEYYTRLLIVPSFHILADRNTKHRLRPRAREDAAARQRIYPRLRPVRRRYRLRRARAQRDAARPDQG